MLVTFGNGVTQATTFDPVSRLKSLTNNLSGTTNDHTIGNLTYNPASQIVAAPKSNNAYAFGGYAGVNRPYAANGLNQYGSAGSATFTYDARGNLISDGTYTFGFSSENLMTSGPGGATIAYDPLTRLYQSSGSVTTRFADDGLNMIAEYNGSNALLRRHVFAPGIDRPIAGYEGSTISSATRRFFSSDERGSIISITDFAGTKLGINTYDEMASPPPPTGTGSNIPARPGSQRSASTTIKLGSTRRP